MKSVKKVLAIFLVAILMTTTFAGCGRTDEVQDTPDVTATATPEETSTSAPEETPTSTPEDTGEPIAETPEPTPEMTTEVDADKVLGITDGNTYTNEFFGFTMTLPEGWFSASREQLAQILADTEDYLNSETDGNTIDLEAQQIIPLMFTASLDPFTNVSQPNPNIVCLAQNIGEFSSLIKDVQSFLNISAQGVKAQGMEVDMDDMETFSIDGQEIGKFSLSQTQDGMEIRQTMYAFLKHDFAVVFTLSSFSDEDAQLLGDVMDTLSFN